MPEPIASIAATAPATGIGSRGASSFSQPAAAPNSASQEAPITLDQAVSSLNDYFSQQKPPLTFRSGRDVGDLVVEVVDTRNNEVVRQMPSDEALKLARQLARGSASLMSKQQA